MGIHRDLLLHTWVLLVAGVLVFAMGTLVFLAIFIPQIGAMFGGLNSGTRLLFFLVSLFFFWIGCAACIVAPLHFRRITQTVASTPAKPVQLKLMEEQGSDSTDFLVILYGPEAGSYLAKRPGWMSKALLDIPLEGFAHFDAGQKPVAIRLQQGLIWVFNPHDRNKNA